MHYREALPSEPLAGHIKLFWSLEYDQAGEVQPVETILPDGCPEIIFNFSDRFDRLHRNGGAERQPTALFAGQIVSPIQVRPTGDVRLFGVRFHPGGAFPIAGCGLHELTGRVIGLDDVIGDDGGRLESRIREAGHFAARVALFERFFKEKLAGQQFGPNLMAVAVRQIVRSGGRMPISRLSAELGVPDRGLERKFRSQVGLSPKMFSRIVRFQALLGQIRKDETVGLISPILDAGYFDQPHAIRDFREFAGTTPVEYLRSSHTLSDVFTSSVQ